jgi:hypothetical protein
VYQSIKHQKQSGKRIDGYRHTQKPSAQDVVDQSKQHYVVILDYIKQSWVGETPLAAIALYYRLFCRVKSVD